MKRDEILKYLKVQFELQNKYIIKRANDKHNLSPQEHSLETAKLADRLFLKTGFEDYTFQKNSKKLNMFEDKEFMDLFRQNTEKMKNMVGK